MVHGQSCTLQEMRCTLGARYERAPNFLCPDLFLMNFHEKSEMKHRSFDLKNKCKEYFYLIVSNVCVCFLYKVGLQMNITTALFTSLSNFVGYFSDF